MKNRDKFKIMRELDFNKIAPIVEKNKGFRVLTFINDTKFLNSLKLNKDISCLICTKDIFKLEKEYLKRENIKVIIDKNPKDLFFQFHNYLVRETNFYFENNISFISKTASIHPSVIISSKNVIIGENVKIEEGTIIKSNTIIEDNCIIGSNCIIGGESFSFNNLEKIFSGGKTIIEKNVYLLGNNCIEKGIYGNTQIGENTRISYGSIIEHDVSIGEKNLICANVTITGRVKIGNNCYFGPNSVIRNGIVIENNSRVSMGAVVTRNVESNEIVTGNFAIPHEKFLKVFKFFLKSIKERKNV